VLLALNLRTAVAVLSPILSFVSGDIPLGSIGIGLLGMLAPLAFAASGFVAPVVARRVGLETATVLACAAMVAGPLVRAVAFSYPVLVLGSVIAMAGMGFANILLPPVIKKYFPDRIGLLTGTYVTLMAISASVPPLIAAPLAQAAGWRFTLGIWAVLAVGALVPWLVVLAQHRGLARQSAADGAVPAIPRGLLGRMPGSRIAWAIAIAFAVSALNVYGMFAWLPKILIDTAGASPSQAGALVALFAVVGLPFGLVAPVLARVRNVGWVFAAAVACYVVGYLGLLLAPGVATWVWVVLVGTGPLAFPLCLVLINLRTRTHEGSMALSGFVQGIAYAAGALGTLAIGLLHDLTGGWTVPLAFVAGASLLTLVSAVVLARPRMVEDELGLVPPG
jgi:CP family cyanate transporter-like MFS transporter